jgi:hypothetical protein
MAKMKKKDLKGKFIIAFDTLCDGYQCATDEAGKPAPTLFNTKAEAILELFDDALSMIENQSAPERFDNDISEKEFKEMKKISKTRDAELMDNFLFVHQSCNYNGEFVIPADEFIFGKKTIFTSGGLVIEGKTLDKT